MPNNAPFFVFAFSALSCAGVPVDKPTPEGHLVTARDNLVVATVLRDLLSYEGKDSPVRGPFSISQPLPFAKDPGRDVTSVADLLDRREKERWDALSFEQLRAAGQAAENLVRRSKTTVGRFTVAVPQIELRDPQGETDWVSRMLNRPIEALPPGYSPDGDVAIVRLSIPWSTHHSVDGTYVLVAKAGVWTVLLRQFVYYL